MTLVMTDGESISHVKVWVHAVWGTKKHERILTKEIKEELFKHMLANAKEKQIYIDSINGGMEHIHCLFALNADMSIAKVIQLIKGEGAYWANKKLGMNQKLEWANEYFAVSVSESMVDKVRGYIKNQDEHHRKASFSEEYERFVEKYGLSSQG